MLFHSGQIILQLSSLFEKTVSNFPLNASLHILHRSIIIEVLHIAYVKLTKCFLNGHNVSLVLVDNMQLTTKAILQDILCFFYMYASMNISYHLMLLEMDAHTDVVGTPRFKNRNVL